jgi:hypothetical protein
MDADGLFPSELPELKRLAGEILAGDPPDLAVLDAVAALAAAVAADCRERNRRQLCDQLMQSAEAIFQAKPDEVRSRLADLPLAELSSLAAMADGLAGARTRFAQADADLRAAHTRGDYAAMAPLALDADRHKTALAAATADLAKGLGIGGELAAERAPSTVAVETAAEPPPGGDDAGDDDVAGDADADRNGDAGPSADLAPEPRSDRPRLRDLIRQIRAVPEEAAARR